MNHKNILVVQSYKTEGVSDWVQSCLKSVRAWAKAQKYEYSFLGDEFLEYAPEWFRAKSESILPITDLSRLLLIKEQLENYEQVIWVDADVLVFDPQQFVLQLEDGSNFAFCSELWANSPKDGSPIFHRRVNNAVCIFNNNASELDFLIKSALTIMKELNKVGPWDVGVNFLSHAHKTKKFQLINNVGMISPAIMNDITKGEKAYLPYFAKQLPAPMAAANLCGSFVDKKDDFDTSSKTYEQAVRTLLDTKGGVINDYIDKNHIIDK